VKTYPIGDQRRRDGVDAETGLIFSSTGDGHVYVFHQDRRTSTPLLDTLTTFPGSKTMGLDPKEPSHLRSSQRAGKPEVLAFDK